MALEQQISDYEILTRRTRPSAMEIDSPEQLTDLEILSEEKLPETAVHSGLIQYLLNVLGWLFRAEGWYICSDLAIVYAHRRYLSPDVAVYKGLSLSREEFLRLSSYHLDRPGRPAPAVVFEIVSEATWDKDLDEKPQQYGRIGVKEYFAYDPNIPRIWPAHLPRLKGWRYGAEGQVTEIEPDGQGRLWSQELDSWLAADEEFLRLYDAGFNLRLTAAEAERAAKETERAAREQLLEKLRRANIDPDKL